MGFIKKHTSLIVMLLGIFALSFALHAEAQLSKKLPNVINPFCTEGNANPAMKVLCSKMVGTSKTWDQAAISSVNRIKRKANRSVKPLLAAIEAKLEPTMPLSEKSQIIETCKVSYEEAIELLQKCNALITVGPFSSFASTLTSIYTSFEDCKDAIFNGKGSQHEIFEVSRFTKSIRNLIDVALIVSKKDPRIADYYQRLARGEFKDSLGDASIIGPISTSTFFGANH